MKKSKSGRERVALAVAADAGIFGDLKPHRPAEQYRCQPASATRFADPGRLGTHHSWRGGLCNPVKAHRHGEHASHCPLDVGRDGWRGRVHVQDAASDHQNLRQTDELRLPRRPRYLIRCPSGHILPQHASVRHPRRGYDTDEVRSPSQTETWLGCMLRWTTSMRSVWTVARSTASRNPALNAAMVASAS